MADISRSFDAVVIVGPKGRVMVRLPFAPDDVWGTKPDHHVAGTIGSHRVRAVVESFDAGYGIVLGPAWRRDCVYLRYIDSTKRRPDLRVKRIAEVVTLLATNVKVRPS